jgi:hypothetical protein
MVERKQLSYAAHSIEWPHFWGGPRAMDHKEVVAMARALTVRIG